MARKVAIVGGGVIGGGWAARFLLNGWDVGVFDPDPQAERKIAEVMVKWDKVEMAALNGAGPLPEFQVPMLIADSYAGYPSDLPTNGDKLTSETNLLPFLDIGMIRQIEEKVVNRLRQVTSAIKQDGANQVSIITSTAERQAAVEFAKAAAIRPQIVGESLQKISQDREVSEAMFEILETQKVVSSGAKLTVLPQNGELLAQLIAGHPDAAVTSAGPPPLH